MKISNTIRSAVRPNSIATPEPNGRAGTIRGLTLADMRTRFGEPHDTGDGEKVTAVWRFNTPRGTVEVRDYWWNHADELSIAGTRKQAMWLAAYFRRQGVRAHLGTHSKEIWS